MTCIRCGAEEDQYRYLCQNCYLQEHPIEIFKKKFRIRACMKCLRLGFREKWFSHVLTDEGFVVNEVLKDYFSKILPLSWKITQKHHIQLLDLEVVSYGYEGEPISLEGVIRIQVDVDPFLPRVELEETFQCSIRWRTCTDCQKIAQGAYQSKLQVRGVLDDDDVRSLIHDIQTHVEFLEGKGVKGQVIRIEEIKGGFDVYCNHKHLARKVADMLAEKFGAIVQETTEFAGFDRHKSKPKPRRHVTKVRLPPYRTGDLLYFNESIYQFLLHKNKNFWLWSYSKHVAEKFSIESLWELQPIIISRPEHLRGFQVLNWNQNDEVTEIMDQQSFQIFYVESKEIPKKSRHPGAYFSGYIIEDSVYPDHSDNEMVAFPEPSIAQ